MHMEATSQVITRLLKVTAIFGFLMAGFAAWRFGWRSGAGLAVGVVVADLNLASLSRAVEGLADRIVDAQSGERGGRLIARFLFRYVLIVVISYVIFRGSSQAFQGFLAGLCSPVAALMLEAILGIAGLVRES